MFALFVDVTFSSYELSLYISVIISVILLDIYLVINFLVWNVHRHLPFVLFERPCIWHLVCPGGIV
jgi:hypothetical protein